MKLFLITCSLLLQTITAIRNSRYYPRYHAAAQNGTMKGASGFTILDGVYHLFYERIAPSSILNRASATSWGHQVSPDFFNWEHFPDALTPRDDFSSDGVLTGSAIVENDNMILYYTGNNITSRGGLLQNDTFVQRQASAVSTDGINFSKSVDNPIVKGDEFQPDFRHPKVWKHKDTFYMVVGNSFNGRGRAILYTSKDGISFEDPTILHETDGTVGRMWENVDFFELRGQWALIVSVKDMPSQGFRFRNKVTVLYRIGKFSYVTKKFEPITKFKEFDSGHDFCFTQTLQLRFPFRRVAIGLLGMEGQNYPETLDAWTGMMSLPRELSIDRSNTLTQTPIREVRSIRGRTIQRGNYRGEKILLPDKAGEFNIRSRTRRGFIINIESERILNRVSVRYDRINGELSINRPGLDGTRIALFRPSGRTLECDLYIDASSIEVFCDGGRVVLSSRIFLDGENVTLSAPLPLTIRTIRARSLMRTVPIPGENEL